MPSERHEQNLEDSKFYGLRSRSVSKQDIKLASASKRTCGVEKKELKFWQDVLAIAFAAAVFILVLYWTCFRSLPYCDSPEIVPGIASLENC